MANFDSIPRVGRSQGAVIFWGLVSVFFAAAFCYYYWQNSENEVSARELREEVLTLQSQRETLNSEKAELQASIGDTKKQLDAREEFLEEKETKLAAEESRLESLGALPPTQTAAQNPVQNPAPPSPSQVSVLKKFDETVRKLSKGNSDDEIVTRGGRLVLRVPSGVFFAVGDATLKPDGKAVLNQLADALNNQLDNFELRIENFTDGDAEIESAADSAAAAKPDPNAKPNKLAPPPDAKPRFFNSWDLTAARAAALARFLRDQTSLPFQNVIVIARADSQPIVSKGKEGHARNSRIELTLAPVPVPFHSADATKAGSDTKPNPLTPPPDAPAAKDKGN